eukprot:19958-Chlamydomonas_euryale.AAC.1
MVHGRSAGWGAWCMAGRLGGAHGAWQVGAAHGAWQVRRCAWCMASPALRVVHGKSGAARGAWQVRRCAWCMAGPALRM